MISLSVESESIWLIEMVQNGHLEGLDVGLAGRILDIIVKVYTVLGR